MATYCHAAVREKGDVYKIIRLQDGEVIVNYDNLGDAVLVCYALTMCKVRHAMRKLSSDEAEAYYRGREALMVGDGI